MPTYNIEILWWCIKCNYLVILKKSSTQLHLYFYYLVIIKSYTYLIKSNKLLNDLYNFFFKKKQLQRILIIFLWIENIIIDLQYIFLNMKNRLNIVPKIYYILCKIILVQWLTNPPNFYSLIIMSIVFIQYLDYIISLRMKL